MSERDYLGTGMKFPPQIDPGTGRFALSSHEQSVRESVYLILMTNQGERWLEPQFGSTVATYTFMDNSPTMTRMMIDEIRDMLLSQEPRIGSLEVDVDSESRQGCLLINIRYTVAGSSKPENLVFPFYLNAVREEMDNEA